MVNDEPDLPINGSSRMFAVVRTMQPGLWDPALAQDEQKDWHAHFSYMQSLVADGFIVAGGPLEATADALFIVRAQSPEDIEQHLRRDPWSPWLVTTRAAPWGLLLGSIG